jgi:DNA-binding CsgD family transcriptional regulator
MQARAAAAVWSCGSTWRIILVRNRGMTMELLERGPFLQTLAEYAGQARQGTGRLVLVSGESGMGKTMLLEAFQDSSPDARWLWGGCDGLLTPRPLGPLFDIGAQVGGELAALGRDGAPRDQMFTAFLTELGTGAPFTVAVLEDVHWADEATADLLSFLGRRLSRSPVLLVATYRDDELAADHPLRMVLGDLATQRATRRMRLPPLSRDAVATLVGSRDIDAAELHRVTGGNPFYVTEMLAAGWPSVPPTVRDAVGARLARSAPATRQLVQCAAMIGARVDRSLLATVADVAAPAIDDRLLTGILTADGRGLRFRHELVRLAVTESVTPHRKVELHARLLAELEQRGGADPAVLAHHAEGAGDDKAVLRHAPQAARRSAALGAHREAAAQFERALRHAAGRDGATLAPLHEGLALEYSLLDRWHEAEQPLRTALRLRRELGDGRSVGENLRMLSKTLWRLCRGEESEQAAFEAVEVLEALPPGPELAWAYANLSSFYMVWGRTAEAVAAGAKARDLGERLDQPEILSEALNSLGCALVIAGQGGLEPVRQALRIALDGNLHEAAGRTFCNLQSLGTALNEFDEAERYYTQGMAFCEERQLGVYSTCLSGGRAWALLLAGRWDEAAQIAGDMLKSKLASPVNRMNPLQVLGTIRGLRGADGGWELLDEALALAEGTGEPQWIVPLRAGRAELHWLSGNPGAALREARSGYELGRGYVHQWALGSVAIWLARAGEPVRPGPGLPEAGGPGRRLPEPGGSEPGLPEPYARELAGDWAAAALAWQQAGRPYDAAMAWLGSADEAGLRQALTVFDDLGARLPAAAARRRMKELGIRAIPRGPRPATKAGPAGLTAREQEVLALLAEGLPDREISRRLFISERTVHHHVSAVLGKIGVSSRTAAAREAARLGIGAPA